MVSTSTCRICVFLLALLLSAVVVAYSLYLTWRPTADQTATNTTGSRAVESLKYVVVVARHGNRRLYTYPNDPYPPSNKTLWPYSLGALTVKGRNEMYNLGVKIRTLYNGFLDQYYSGDKFYASSTPYERVMTSGQAFVAGLFPPLGYEIWDKNILWQPIPVYDDSPDKLSVADAGTCPRLNQARTLSISQTIEEYQANYTEVNDYFMPYTGSNVSGFSGVYYVFDASIAEEFEEYPLPDWLLEVYPAPMTELVGEVYIGLNAANDLEKGRNEMYNLGVKIRTLYNGFLDQYYSGDKFYASSTPYERVMTSGQAFVAGLFPPLGYEIWDKNILWQPIPVYDDSPDKLSVADAGTCPRLNQARTLSISQTIEEYQANYTEVNDYFMPYTGSNVSGFSGVYYVFDASIAEEFEEYPLPDWLLEVYPAPMTELVGEVYIGLNAANDLEVRLIIGPLIQQMMGLMQSKANGTLTPDRQMHFYSGHDTSLITLQGTLGIAKSSMIGLVKPASAMLFELHQDPDSGQFYVQVLYIDGGSEDLDPFPFDIPNCGESCDFDQLVNITSKFCNITDYWAECQFNYTSEASLSL